MQDEQEIKLIKQLKNGEEVAFVFLFKEYYQKLYLFAVNYLKDEDIAHDIMQELFSDLFEKAECIQISTSVKAYLFMATRNRCLNFLRSLKIKDSHYQNILEAHLDSDTVSGIEDPEMLRVIRALVATLPAGCQNVFNLRVIKDYKYKEIAEELGISENNAKVQMNNIIQLLRQKIPFIRNELILCLVCRSK